MQRNSYHASVCIQISESAKTVSKNITNGSVILWLSLDFLHADTQ